MYRTVPIGSSAGAKEPVIETLEFCVGERTPSATVVHVRGTCAGEIPFAGCMVVEEGRELPPHDLKSYGAPVDLEQLAIAIDRLLGENSAVSDEIRQLRE